ncbi:hypothetical protein HELRODRAFT_193756 [Helobdella robusta]|uniref:Uncharacterized protein n=1 Tax=Helobdella robusta TaxID=6412 RepID=T1FVB6_HELRO|nr:hypothetical protein HELRODRAFT_193756 [Helobdella robusta]ESN94882.1 hypothetical protein HELRODRAFT_193756 [Helobdella robusta]
MYRETEVEAKVTRWAKVYHSSSVESFSALIGTYNEVQSFEKYIEEITKHACSSESRLYPLELLREQCTVLAQCNGSWYKEMISEQHIKHYPVRLEETKPLIRVVNCALKVINYKSKSAEQAFCEFRELTSNVFLVVLAMDYNENKKVTYVDFLLNKADKKSSLCKKIFGPWDNDDDKVVTRSVKASKLSGMDSLTVWVKMGLECGISPKYSGSFTSHWPADLGDCPENLMCACKFIADFMELHFDGDVRVNDAVMKKVLDVVELLKMAMFYQNFKMEIKEELYALITTFDKFYKRRHALTQTDGETDVGITSTGSKEAVDRDDERFLNDEKSYSPPMLQNVWCHPTATTTRSSTATKPTTLSTATTVQRNSGVTQTKDVKNSRAISKSGEFSCMPGFCAMLMDSSTDGSRSGSSLSDRVKLKNVAPLKTYHQQSHDDENDKEDEKEEKDDGNYESNSDHSNTEKRQPLKCAEPDVTSPSKPPPSSVDNANDSSCSSANGYYNSEVDNDAKSLETKYHQVTKKDNRSFFIQTPSASSADESNSHDVASSIRSDVEKKLGNEKMITQDVLKPNDKCDNNNSTTIDGQTELGTFDLSYNEKNVKWAFYKLTPKKDKGVDEHYGPKSKKNAKKQQQGSAVSASLSNTSLGNLTNVTADDDDNFPPLSSSSNRNSNRNYDASCNGEANETNKLHWLSDENKPLEQQLKFGETVRCTNCHGVGHYSKYCTKPAKNTGFFC